MYLADVRRVVEQVSRDKGIGGEVLFRALEEAIRSAAKKKFGVKAEIEVNYTSESGEIEVFQFKEVVDVVIEPELQISHDEGLKLDSECQLGDSLGSKIDVSSFGRIAAQSAKQVIIQKIRDAEKNAIYLGYISKKGEIINGIVQRLDKGNIIVNLGLTEGILRLKEQISGENYGRGDRIRALILDILYDTKGPQILLSRSHPDFLVVLFKTEVPEIGDGVIEVKGAVREPGSRSKLSVFSNDLNVDPVGSCVGVKGNRVQSVVQELNGEKVDIIIWHLDPVKYVCNSLALSEITRVVLDEENHFMEVVVPDEFLSIAIGKYGQNVRLASKLTGWKLEVSDESSYNKFTKNIYNLLVDIPDIDNDLARILIKAEIFFISVLANSTIIDIIEIGNLDNEKALLIINNSNLYVIRFIEVVNISVYFFDPKLVKNIF